MPLSPVEPATIFTVEPPTFAAHEVGIVIVLHYTSSGVDRLVNRKYIVTSFQKSGILTTCLSSVRLTVVPTLNCVCR